MLAEPIIIPQWWKNRSGEVVRVRLTAYQNRNIIDLRGWHSTEGTLVPGKGFAADVRHLPHLAAALTKAESKARELGLIAGGNDNNVGGQ
jgi:hypothetical protein